MFLEVTEPISSPARSPQPGDIRAARGLGANSFPVLVTAATNYVITPTRVTYPTGARFGLRSTIISPQGIPSTTFQAVLVQVTPQSRASFPREHPLRHAGRAVFA